MGLLDDLNPFDGQNWANFGSGLDRVSEAIFGDVVEQAASAPWFSPESRAAAAVVAADPAYAYTPQQATQNALAAGAVVATSPLALNPVNLAFGWDGDLRDYAAGWQRILGVSPEIALAPAGQPFAPEGVAWRYTPQEAYHKTLADGADTAKKAFDGVADIIPWGLLIGVGAAVLAGPPLIAALAKKEED